MVRVADRWARPWPPRALCWRGERRPRGGTHAGGGGGAARLARKRCIQRKKIGGNPTGIAGDAGHAAVC